MNLHRAHTEILILAVAAVMVLLVSVATKAPVQRVVAPQVSGQAVVPVSMQAPAEARAAAIQAVPATFQTISAPQTHSDSDWVRADSVEAPAKQTRWVF
ncbi:MULTISPECIES: hypothetical protein [unclassified Pseudomonas]|uniref:hypothetical protein n=1 Tax=unclassified Pseudomonas TaxID=196821 RepID=UPI0009644DEA|nr:MULTISPECIES: hypothetical protein [unclassified Pseudomonas]OLU16452.1 hypothetical protein BVH01_07600 [Pseudomonas sp. PA1(2017)]OLU34606.1 hypothetical protein BVH06_06295 [Pseudomonas sp. PA27(2017)]